MSSIAKKHNDKVDVFNDKEIALKVKELMFDVLLRDTPMAFYWCDRKGIMLGCNDMELKILGYSSKGEFVGKHALEACSSQIMWENHRTVMETGVAQVFEEALVLLNGEKRYYISMKHPLLDPENKIVGMLGISLDITERKQMEEALRKAKKKAEKADRAKTEFIVNMEHDLRTPLGHIVGLADVLGSVNSLASKDKELVEHIRISGQRLINLIDEILLLVNSETGYMPKVSEQFVLSEVIQQVNDIMGVAKQKGLEVLVVCDENIPGMLVGDKARLNRILLNLISNAVKFTAEGCIKIHAKKVKWLNDKTVMLAISVTDTGIGIPEDKHKDIFKRFTRLTSANSNLYKGLGVGLSIVKQFVREMKGKIEVKSKVGKGTTFTCYLPFTVADVEQNISQNEEKLPDAAEVNIAKSYRKKCKILLIEDEEFAQLVETKIFKDFGCIVDIAVSAHEALKLVVAKNKYDIVIMDLGLPDMDGISLAKELRQKLPKAVPIIVVTAHSENKKGEQAQKVGVSDFYRKPLNIKSGQKILEKWENLN
ncbi:MAG: hypothetical protein A2X78_02760 [Gammaproteobacteria bacterium GWE2_37_16]|nr:MAG: hypothetical protein A2X78_02760 [Gammaproteobacteria bacterium GWE2_37_16]